MSKQILVAAASLLLAFGASAQDVSIEQSLSVTATSTPAKIRDTFKKDLQNIRDTFKGGVKNINENKREELKTIIEKRQIETRAIVDKKREDFKRILENKKEDLENRIEAKREELKTRLQNIRDENKRETVERIDKRLDEINKNRLEHFTNILDRLDEILLRITSRTDKAEQNGKNVTEVRTAISAANTAIANARAAITVQAGKTYSITVTTEADLRDAVKTARKALHDDLKKVFDLVKAARTAVHNAATTLAKIPGVNVDASASATTTVNN